MPTFNVHSEALVKTWPRMTPAEQAYAHDMHGHYEQQFKRHKRDHAQPEGMAAGVHGVVDDLVGELVATDPAAPGIKCHRGCSHCCRIAVTITQPEARLLHFAARAAGIELDRDKLKRQALHTVADWHQLPAADSACVFLDQMGSCKVYEHRPAVCRKYFALSEPELCDVAEHPKEQVLNFVSLKAEIVASAAMAVFESGTMPAMLLKHQSPE